MFEFRMQGDQTPSQNGQIQGTFENLKSDRDDLMSERDTPQTPKIPQDHTFSEQEEEAISSLQKFIQKEEKFRIQLEKKVTTEALGRRLELVVGFLSLGTSALNVVFQYLEPMPGPIYAIFNQIDFAACCYFFGVFTLKLYVASHRGNHLMQTQSILELLVFAPILLFMNVNNDSQLSVLLPFSRYIRAIQSFMIFSRYYKLGQTDVDRQINIVFITMVLLTYISSGIYSIVENRDRIDAPNYLQLHDSVYFVIVTLATVGYGDEIPMTEFGRVVVLIIIFLTIVLIPAQTNELLRLMSIRSRFRRIEYKSLDVQHIAIFGSVGVDALTNICEELYHPDHGGDAFNVVIMQDFDPDGDLDAFINKNFLSMTYLAGDPFEDSDLHRAMLHTAEQCIILTNKNSKDSQKQDYKNILTALALKKFVYEQNLHLKNQERQNLSLCIQLIKPESKYLYYKSLNISAARDQLIIVEEIKMNLLAKSCFSPGLIACMSNLAASASTDDLNLEEEWLNEYANGMGHEIYRMEISEEKFLKANPKKVNFKNIADCAFFEFQSLIFALEIEVKESSKSIVRLNPALFLFEDWERFNYYLYIICEDESNAEQVQNMDIPIEKFEAYFGNSRKDDLPRNLQDDADSPQGFSRQVSALGEPNEIDNPELMNMKTSDNFYKKKDDIQNRGIQEMKLNMKVNEMPSHDSKSPQNKLKNKNKAVENSLENKSQVIKENQRRAGLEQNRKKQQSKINKQNDLLKDYDILPNSQSLTEVIINSRNVKLKNHIIVCGLHSSIYHFILPLRAKYLMNYQQDIVIIAPHIKKEIWEGICRFPRVFIVEGSPISHEVLRVACIKNASKAVIMGQDPSISTETFSELTDQMIDAKSIFIYKAIKKINPNLQVFTELFYQQNIDYLNQNQTKNNNLGYMFRSVYAAGEVYISSTIDTLTAQSFYNPHIVTIFQQILVGKGERKTETDDQEQEILDMFEQGLDQSNLWQILVPEEFLNQTYEKLFKHLLERNLVAIGLYRLPGATDNKCAYCYTNPDPSTNISSKDRVFVLGKDIPEDISLDIVQTKYNNEDNKNTKKQKAKLLRDASIKHSAEVYYGIGLLSEQVPSPRKPSPPPIITQLSVQQNENSEQNYKKSNTFGPRQTTFQAPSNSEHCSPKKKGLQSSLKTMSPTKNRRKSCKITTPAQNEFQFDDSQDQQMTSMEFMLRAINCLEDQLGNIENTVQQVKQKIANQNILIQQKVLEVKKNVLGKTLLIEQSGFQQENQLA